MGDILSIPKKEPTSSSVNYAFLREQGLKHIENLGSKIWTDYNIHDPGITILEILCFAITDLGYRTSFDIKDLLAEPKDSSTGPQFFTAKEVLTCNPVTEIDFRKILIDTPGVKNAWLSVAESSESNIYVNCSESLLEHNNGSSKNRLPLRGLYDIRLELEDDIDLSESDSIISSVKNRLHRCRNLCEDYISIDVIGIEKVSLCSDIDIAAGYDINEILAELYFRVNQFISPSLQFYSLNEMLDKGGRSEEIFDGPFLKHGFIDSEELEKTVLPSELHLSDLYRLIMDIDGVESIQRLVVRLHDSNDNVIRSEEWSLPLNAPDRKMQFSTELSSITFFNNMIPLYANKDKVEVLYKIKKGSHKKQYSDSELNDLPVPKGTYHDLKDYTSIQEEFPLTYGIGSSGLPDSSTDIRKAQSKQLQGYLVFYDQLLGNYLAQLSRVKDLLSISNTEDSTYFANALLDIPDAKYLFKDFDENENDWNTFKADPDNAYITFMKDSLEDDFIKWNRRNRFLDHLMARFGERFNDYALLMYDVYGNQINPDLVADKEDMLKDYPVISHDRGRAFNYKAWNDLSSKADVWNTTNVSGLEARIARLLGIKDFSRRDLTCDSVYKTEVYRVRSGPQVGKYRFRVRDRDNNIILKSAWAYKDDILARINESRLQSRLFNMDAYDIMAVDGDTYQLIIKTSENKHLAKSKQKYDSEPEAKAFMYKLMEEACPEQDCNNEGFHLVEHILLRPNDRDYDLLPINLDIDSCTEVGNTYMESADPYSYRMTLVIPAWPNRFREWTFRRFIENTIRKETPAHIAIRICWISCMQMHEFQEAYRVWLELRAIVPKDDNERVSLTEPIKDAANKLIKVLFSLKNVHKVAKLYDCKNNEEALILGFSRLGQY